MRMPMEPLPESRWARIRMFAMDVDGILTDGRVYIASNGTESKAFSVVDGLGLSRIRKAGLLVAWISGRASDSTTARASELKISRLLQGRNDKESCLKELMEEAGLKAAEVCYMGDDVIDVPAMRIAGIGVTVPEAALAVRENADWITARAGGFGAVREVCDLLMDARTEKQYETER